MSSTKSCLVLLLTEPLRPFMPAPNEHCIAITQAATKIPAWAPCSEKGTGLTNRDLKNLAGASADNIVPHREAQRGNDRVARPTKIGMSPAPPALARQPETAIQTAGKLLRTSTLQRA